MRTIFALGLTVVAGAALVAPAQAQPPGGGAGGPPNFMQFADADKDGKVSLAEFTTLNERRWERLSQGADKVPTCRASRPARSPASRPPLTAL